MYLIKYILVEICEKSIVECSKDQVWKKSRLVERKVERTKKMIGTLWVDLSQALVDLMMLFA